MDEYASIDYGKDYLAHHGVKGMKWGVRNTIERMGISRKLRKNEKEYVKNQQQMLNAVRIKNRLKEKGRNTQLIDKQINAINSNISKNKNTTKQLLKDAKSKGYSVSSKDTRTGAQNYAVKSATRSAALNATITGLSGAATAAAYLGAAATVPITAPAAAIILGSYAAGAAAGGAVKGGLLGGAMGASYGSAVVSMQRKRGYQYADKVFNKNNDVPASILYKKYSISDMKHFDEFYSDYLAHYGVKGMKWGVRKSVERTGRVVRKMGGAVKNSATRIAGGLVKAGSAVRRAKNRRAIRSGNSERISKRINKMNTQELSEAVTRMQLANQIAANNAHRNTNTLGDVVSNSLKQKVGQMSQNALQTSVESVLRGESPLTGMIRNAKAQKASQEQQISQNISSTIANNYKIANSALQNKMNISAMEQQIAKNRYNAANDRQNLRNLNLQNAVNISNMNAQIAKNRYDAANSNQSLHDLLKSASTQSSRSTPISKPNTAIRTGSNIAKELFARPKQPTYSQAMRMNSFGSSSAKIVLYDNGIKPIVDLNAATRRSSTGAYTPRFVRHDDINEYISDFLAHYGVKGMKWGVRKDRSISDLKKRIMYGDSVDDRHRLWNNADWHGKYDNYDEDVLAERDIARDLYAHDVSFGKAMARRLIMGKKRSQNYNKLRASADSVYDLAYIKKDINRPVSEISDEEIGRAALKVNESMLQAVAIPNDEPWEWHESFKKGTKIRYGHELNFLDTMDSHLKNSRRFTRHDDIDEYASDFLAHLTGR